MYIFRQELEATLEVFRSLLNNQDFSIPTKIIYKYCKELIGSENGFGLIFDKGKRIYKVIFIDYGEKVGLSPDGDYNIKLNKDEEDSLHVIIKNYVYIDNNPEYADILTGILPNYPKIENLLYIPINIENDTEGFLIFSNKKDGFSKKDTDIANKFNKMASLSYSTSKTINYLNKKIIDYENIVEDQLELIYRIKPDGEITYLNKGICNFYNIDRENIIGKSIYEILPERQIRNIRRKIDKISKKRSIISRTFKLVTPDGESHWIEFRYAAILDADKQVAEYQGIGMRITNKARIERILGRRLRFIKFVNKISFEFINTSTSDIDNLIDKALEFVTKYTNVERGYIFRIYEDEGEFRLTNEWCKEGVLSHRGILDSVRIEDFKDFIETLRDGKTITLSISDMKPSKENQPMINILTMLNIKSFINIPLLVDNELIGYIGFDSTKKEMGWSKGSVRAFNITGHIIATALKRYFSEKSLKEYTRKLEETNEELEQFAYMVPHDLKNPLISIISALRMIEMKTEGKLDKEGEDILNKTKKRAHTAVDMITELLSYTRINREISSFYKVNTENIINKVIDNLHTIIEEKYVVIEFYNLPQVKGNEKLLLILFQNLIENAIKYRSKQVPKIYIEAKKKDDKWLFSVRDNGIGINPDYHKLIFKIFRRACDEDKYQGTGIGLSTCKKIINIHNGEIWVESEPKKGSTFYFTLPMI